MRPQKGGWGVEKGKFEDRRKLLFSFEESKIGMKHFGPLVSSTSLSRFCAVDLVDGSRFQPQHEVVTGCAAMPIPPRRR